LLPPVETSLIPVYDSHLKQALGRPRNDQAWWRDLRCELTGDATLISELETVRARAGAGHLSLLRTFDIMCWMFAENPEAAEAAA
jgi:Family of unknown function (DUF6308)